MEFKHLDKTFANDIAQLAVCLTQEIIEKTGTKHFDLNVPKAKVLCEKFINQGHYFVIGALKNDRLIGFGSLCES